MANDFKKPKKIEYEGLDQDTIDPVKKEDKPLATEFEDVDSTQSSASVIVEEYSRTIEFQKFLEQLLRDISKVEIEINPEDDPEVWIAMTRVFNNPSPKLNQDSYFQVLDALETMERIEQVEDDPRNNVEDDFLDNLPDAQEVDESEIKDADFQVSAIDEIEEKAKVRRSSAFKSPPPPAPKPPPPEENPWRRRWRKMFRVVHVLGRPYKVQWLRNRWWRDKRR